VCPESNINTGEYANVIRTMIEHEDSLASSRVNWFIVIQGLLFAAFRGLGDHDQIVFVLVAVGIMISVSFFVSFKTSEKSIANLLAFWDRHLEKTGGKWEDYPPVIGVNLISRGIWGVLDRFISTRKILPWAFTIAWIIICILNITGK
jgi:hypothetical protein